MGRLAGHDEEFFGLSVGGGAKGTAEDSEERGEEEAVHGDVWLRLSCRMAYVRVSGSRFQVSSWLTEFVTGAALKFEKFFVWGT